jgi:hypothetical protein
MQKVLETQYEGWHRYERVVPFNASSDAPSTARTEAGYREVFRVKLACGHEVLHMGPIEKERNLVATSTLIPSQLPCPVCG